MCASESGVCVNPWCKTDADCEEGEVCNLARYRCRNSSGTERLIKPKQMRVQGLQEQEKLQDKPLFKPREAKQTAKVSQSRLTARPMRTAQKRANYAQLSQERVCESLVHRGCRLRGRIILLHWQVQVPKQYRMS